MIPTHNNEDVELGALALSNAVEVYGPTIGSKAVLDATSRRIASRAVRKAAHDLNGSDPSIDIVVQWLLKRASDIRDGVL
jgi:hypothetical protein